MNVCGKERRVDGCIDVRLDVSLVSKFEVMIRRFDANAKMEILEDSTCIISDGLFILPCVAVWNDVQLYKGNSRDRADCFL